MTDDLLMGIPVMFPDHATQQVYADMLDKVESRLQAAQKEYELLIKLKDGYVQQLFIWKAVASIPSLQIQGFLE